MNWIKSIYLPVVIVIILFGIILYYLFNRKPYLEGFESQTWSTSTRDAFKKYLLSTNPSWNEDLLNSRCDMYSKDFGATDKDALYFTANKKWPLTETEKKIFFDIMKNIPGPKKTDAEIQKHIPEFKIKYKPDSRQAIANSWPQSIDDSKAREDWGWNHQFDLKNMTEDMLQNLQK